MDFTSCQSCMHAFPNPITYIYLAIAIYGKYLKYIVQSVDVHAHGYVASHIVYAT